MTRTKGYTWEVEFDAIAWETAVDGIDTMEQQLRAGQVGIVIHLGRKMSTKQPMKECPRSLSCSS